MDQVYKLFEGPFDDHVVAMQVTGGEGSTAASTELSLWALSGKKMYKFSLGQRLDDSDP